MAWRERRSISCANVQDSAGAAWEASVATHDPNPTISPSVTLFVDVKGLLGHLTDEEVADLAIWRRLVAKRRLFEAVRRHQAARLTAFGGHVEAVRAHWVADATALADGRVDDHLPRDHHHHCSNSLALPNFCSRVGPGFQTGSSHVKLAVLKCAAIGRRESPEFSAREVHFESNSVSLHSVRKKFLNIV